MAQIEASLQAEFDQAAADAKNLKTCSQADQLILYGLFKQANVGDCNIPQPGFFSPKEGAKWTAWNKNKGMSQKEAAENYVMKVAQLKEAQ